MHKRPGRSQGVDYCAYAGHGGVPSAGWSRPSGVRRGARQTAHNSNAPNTGSALAGTASG
jgi:hypothetical protein